MFKTFKKDFSIIGIGSFILCMVGSVLNDLLSRVIDSLILKWVLVVIISLALVLIYIFVHFAIRSRLKASAQNALNKNDVYKLIIENDRLIKEYLKMGKPMENIKNIYLRKIELNICNLVSYYVSLPKEDVSLIIIQEQTSFLRSHSADCSMLDKLKMIKEK